LVTRGSIDRYCLHPTQLFKKHFSKTPLFRIFVSMVAYVIIALMIMMLLTWPSFYLVHSDGHLTDRTVSTFYAFAEQDVSQDFLRLSGV
jgi:hypothetical protein